MTDLIFNVLFIITSLFVSMKTIFYAIYEIKNESNKIGGIGVIVFSVFVTVFANIIVFMH